MRKICIVTGSRAEYGIMYYLLKEIEQDPELELQLIVTGTHLSPEFGLTYQEIENDGFRIDVKLEMLLSSDSSIGVTKSMGLGLIGFADALHQLSPDIIVVLGDRYEIMVAAQAAMMFNIPIAHLHGGEKTEGANDESIRHAITKMAHIHFVATEGYRNRVIQLGEQPDRVFQVGALGLDNIVREPLMTREDFEKSIDFKLGRTNLIITYHPVTLANQSSEYLTQQLLAALEHFPDARMIITKPNSDRDGRVISQMLDEYAGRYPQRIKCVTSLGRVRYLSALQFVDAVIGNSSSGIIEAPMFSVPTVNIGDRQKGRDRGSSVVDCGNTADEIIKAISEALIITQEQHLKDASCSIYGDGHTAGRVTNLLKTIHLDNIVQKVFYDMPKEVK